MHSIMFLVQTSELFIRNDSSLIEINFNPTDYNKQIIISISVMIEQTKKSYFKFVMMTE